MIIVEVLIAIGLVVTHAVVGYSGFKIGKKFSKQESK
jgi:hypothetical protein